MVRPTEFDERNPLWSARVPEKLRRTLNANAAALGVRNGEYLDLLLAKALGTDNYTPFYPETHSRIYVKINGVSEIS